MSENTWGKVEELFLAALELPLAERAAFLEQESGSDLELRQEAESLLAADAADGRGIALIVEDAAASLFEHDGMAGRRLGAYRVIQEIGRGGMGVVYLAIRADDQFQKQVAIKVVKRGMDTAEVLGRFRHERQILANLDHPYIARLLDGGTTFDGRPFFVMDYVEGQPLDVFCSGHNLDVKTRCQLFLRILEAVAHAHRNLVVHRDLKPGNIFVTRDGCPKLLDFGVAKLLSVDSGPGVTVTAPARPFTPQYASPEQVRGLPVTTATDIYSLGAVFYELLTGQRAQPIAALTPNEVERVICHTEVPRPSLLASNLDSDLDDIILMALRKDPERRYQSVDQLADDVRRHLSGRPILARQDSFWYRTRKFVQRNRFKIVGTGLVFVSLVAGLVVAISESRQAQSARHVAEAQRAVAERERARAETGFKQAEVARASESQQRLKADHERDQAVRERARADQRLTQLLNLADKTLFDIHDEVAKLPGAIEVRQALVRTTLDYLESIEKEHGLEDRMRLALAAGYSKIAAVQGEPNRPSLGDFEGARDSYRKAKALLVPLFARRKNDPTVIVRWIEVEGGLADLTCRHFQRKEGIEAFLRLIPITRRLAGLLPSDPQAVKQEAVIEGRLSIALMVTDSVVALQHARRYVAILSELSNRFPVDLDLKQELGVALADTASSVKDSGDLAQAAEDFERSIRMREQLLEQQPHNVTIQRNLLVAYGNYASLLGIPWSANLGRFAEARVYCEKSVALARQLARADRQDKTARYDLGISLARLGMVEPDPATITASLKSLEEALAILDPIAKANPSSTSITSQVALAREFAGYRLRSLGQPAAAAEHFRQALADLELMMRAHPGQPIGIPRALANEEALAGLYADDGDRADALELAKHAVDRAEKYAGTYPEREIPRGYLGNAYFALASVQRTLGDWDRAREAAEHAMSLWGTIKHAGVISVHRPAREQAEALMREIAVHRTQ